MANDNINFSANTDAFNEAIKKAIATVKPFRQIIDDLIIVSGKLDARGKAVSATVRQLSESGDIVTTTFKRIKHEGYNAFEPVSQSVKKATKDVSEHIQVVDELSKKRAAAAKGAATKFINKIDSTPIKEGQASPAEALKLGQANEALRAFIVANGIALKDLNRIWGEINSGHIQAYEGEVAKLVQLMLKVKDAQEGLGDSSDKVFQRILADNLKRIEQETKIALKQQEQNALLATQERLAKSAQAGRAEGAGFISTLGAAPKDATTKELLDFNKASENLLRFTESNRFSTEAIQQMWKNVSTGAVQQYEGDLQELATLAQKLKVAHDSLGKAAKDASDKEIKAKLAVANREGISNTIFGNLPGFEKLANKQKIIILTMVNQLTELSNKHALTKEQINRIWSDVATGKIQKYVGAQEEVQKSTAKLQEVMGHFNKGLDENGKRINDLTLSWQSFARVFAFTLARSAIFKFQEAVKSSIDTFADLDTQIAAIRTIDDMHTSVVTLRASLFSLSDAWGIDVVDQANAAYESLSNQMGEGISTIAFLNQANALAATTFSTTKDAADLLAATINAYGLEISQAESLSASFFATVDLGRVKVEQIAQTYGRVAAPASILGISVNEVNAALAVLTKRGVPVAEAMTSLRGIFQKLIRPSEEMKKLFSEIGVTSAEAGLSTYGFAGFLEILNQRTQGSSTELGELFQRIRAINGALVLAGSGFDDYGETLRRITLASGDFNEKTELVLESASKKYAIEMNKIKNSITRDFGLTIVNSVNSVDALFKGVTGDVVSFGDAISGVSKVVKFTLIPVVAFLIAQIKLLKVQLAALISNPVALWLAGIALAVEGVIFLLNSQTRAIQNAEIAAASAREEFEKQQQSIITRNAEIANLIRNALRDQNNIYAQELAKTVALFSKSIAQQEADIASLDKTVEQFAKSISANLNNITKGYDSEYDKLRNQMLNLQADLFKQVRTTEQQLFQLGLEGLNPTVAIDEIIDRIEYLRNLRADSVQLGNVEDFNEISKQIEALILQRKQLEEQNLNEFAVDGAKEYYDISTDIVTNVNEELNLQKELIEVLRRKAEEQAKLADAARFEAAHVDQLLDSFKTFKISDIIQGEDSGVVKKLADEQRAVLEQLIEESANRGFDTSAFETALSRLNSLTDDTLEKLVGQELQDNIARVKSDLVELMDTLEGGLTNNKDLLGEVVQQLALVSKTVKGSFSDSDFKSDIIIGNISRELKNLGEAISSGDITQQEFDAFIDRLEGFNEKLINLPNTFERSLLLGDMLVQLRNVAGTGATVVDIMENSIDIQKRQAEIAKELGVSTEVQSAKYELQAKALFDVNAQLLEYNRLMAEQANFNRQVSDFTGPLQLQPLPTITPPAFDNRTPLPAPVDSGSVSISINLNSVNPDYDAVALANAIQGELARGRVAPFTART